MPSVRSRVRGAGIGHLRDTMSTVAPLLALDQAVRAWVVAHRVGALDGVMWTLSAVGRGGMIWVLLAALLVAWGRLERSAALSVVLAVLLGSLAADRVLKPIVNRTRPFVQAPEVTVIGGRPDDSSFPSGHATNAFAGAVVLSALAAAPAIVWWVLAAAIAYSRVYVGVHYPLDVTGGALLGLAVGAGVVGVYRSRVRRRRFPDI
jgi:undecaprenyl-diphosphatase